MNLSQFLLILRAHMKIILMIFGVTVAATLVVSLLLPKQYKASSSVVLNYKATDPVTGLMVTAQALPGYMPTQVNIINSRSVALAVIDNLKLVNEPSVKESYAASGTSTDMRNWLADILLRNLDAVASRDSSVIDITYKGRDPQFVATMANAFAEAYQQVSMQLKLDPTRKASAYFNDQIKVLRDNYEKAQVKLSKYQQDHGITNLDNRMDVESNRLNDLSTQLVMAQGALSEAQSRRQAAGRAQDSPDVNANPLVQNLKANLAASEARFEQAAKRLGKNHPDYMNAKAEVDGLRAQLAAAVSATSASVGTNATILQKREAEVRAEFDAQKQKVLELNRTRDELSVLSRDLDSAQRAYELTAQRYMQTNLEGQSNQSDISILATAVPPTSPSSPRIVINLILSMFVGFVLGVAAALGLELINRRVRSEADLVEGLGLPVLGSIAVPSMDGKRDRRLILGRGSRSLPA
ncbi:chain length determinant protein EpsF [Herbaspirillum robiniae]|uniref:Chain length determinant protein EpsF n=1 Tax=Herbaspirillum robiniae TaxID=2014887 RepID=A0A246WV54_9BURK|nr:chain length determinant protein EpsF [Herbaspirillum robiniae]NUU00247.1 chain length determinant protein EpsF [Herbaspirillum robiniae]OWY30975.1 chain length determinant protein EpsF [Herbaspirillum robiniae]